MICKKIAATFLLGLIVAASPCSADQLPAVEYIDATNIEGDLVPYMEILAELIENYGKDDLRESLRMLNEVKKELRGGYTPKIDEFNFTAKLEGEQETGQFCLFLDKLKKLTDNPLRQSTQENLHTLFSIIKHFYGEDLDNFARQKPTHRPKLSRFLHKIAEYTIMDLDRIVLEMKIAHGYTEESLGKVIAQDMNPSDAKLIEKAQNIDLAKGKFNAKLMLEIAKKLSSYGKFEKLSDWLRRFCHMFSNMYGVNIEIYTWIRLLEPNRFDSAHKTPSSDYLKLTEIWRVCLPVINWETFDLVVKNIDQNMPRANAKESFMDKLVRKNIFGHHRVNPYDRLKSYQSEHDESVTDVS